MDPATGRIQTLHGDLSPRGFQFLRMIASGIKINEIAGTLNVKTVSTYRTRLLNKLELKTNAGLTKYALRNGIV